MNTLHASFSGGCLSLHLDPFPHLPRFSSRSRAPRTRSRSVEWNVLRPKRLRKLACNDRTPSVTTDRKKPIDDRTADYLKEADSEFYDCQKP